MLSLIRNNPTGTVCYLEESDKDQDRDQDQGHSGMGQENDNNTRGAALVETGVEVSLPGSLDQSVSLTGSLDQPVSL